MIETWRQCYTAAVATDRLDFGAYLVLGALRGGGFISEVRFTIAVGQSAAVRLGLVVSGTGQGTADEMTAGTPIIQRSNEALTGGCPAWYFQATMTAYMGQIIIPMWHRVDAGARYVVIGCEVVGDQSVWMLAMATVVGVAKTANGLGVGDGFDK